MSEWDGPAPRPDVLTRKARRGRFGRSSKSKQWE
jgi:hypothetical protein